MLDLLLSVLLRKFNDVVVFDVISKRVEMNNKRISLIRTDILKKIKEVT